MISYHPESLAMPVGTPCTRGFRVVDTNDAERIAKGIARYAWAPGIFEGGWRRKANFIAADWIGLDFETEEFTLAQAVRAFCDMTHVIGTTRSHGLSKDGLPPVDRFRVAIQLEHRCEDGRAFEATLRGIAQAYPIDKACVDSARHFFPCKDIVSVVADGYRQEILEPKPVRRRAVNFGLMPPFVARVLASVVPVGKRNDTFWQVSKDLLRAGFGADDVLTLVIESETYRGEVSDKVRRELADVVESGMKSLMEGPNAGKPG